MLQTTRSSFMRGRAVLALTSALVVIGVATPATAPARGVRKCGSVGSSAGSGYRNIRAYRVSCRRAKQVVYSNGPIPSGWKIEYRDGYDRFSKGKAWITGIPLGD